MRCKNIFALVSPKQECVSAFPEQGPFSGCLHPSSDERVLFAVHHRPPTTDGELTPFTGIFPRCWKLFSYYSYTGITFSLYRKGNWVTRRPRGLRKGISDLRAWNGALNSKFSPEFTTEWGEPAASQGLIHTFPTRQHKVWGLLSFWVPRSNNFIFLV